MNSKKLIKDQIRTMILTKKNPYNAILFNPENNEYIIREKKTFRQATEIEVIAILLSYPEMRVEVLTINQAPWDATRKEFIRNVEPILPEYLKGRHEFVDFSSLQLLKQYASKITNDLIEIKSPVSGIDFDNKIHCTVPGVYRIEMNSKETN